jgi:hypothetical protein
MSGNDYEKHAFLWGLFTGIEIAEMCVDQKFDYQKMQANKDAFNSALSEALDSLYNVATSNMPYTLKRAAIIAKYSDLLESMKS